MFPFNYILTKMALEVHCFGFTVRRIYFNDIKNINPGYTFWNEHWNNWFPIGKFITIRRKSGWIKNFVINHPDRDAFIKLIKTKIKTKQ